MPSADPPSQAHQHVVQLLTVPKAGQVVVVFLGPYRGILTHYVRGETVPCAGDVDCPTPVHRVHPVWKGYAPVRYHQPAGDWWFPAVLEITECLEELLRGRHLAGELWEVFRGAGKRRTRPVGGRYLETRHVDGVFDTFDVVPVLQRRYHGRPLVLDVANPVTPRVILPVVSAPAPGNQATARPSPATEVTEAQRDALRRLAGRGAAAVPSSNGKH